MEEINYEIKYRYLLYRVQQALIEMREEPRVNRGRRHLENGLYVCEQTLDPTEFPVTHEEMTEIKLMLLGGENGPHI
jgi:hypothetical protein